MGLLLVTIAAFALLALAARSPTAAPANGTGTPDVFAALTRETADLGDVVRATRPSDYGSAATAFAVEYDQIDTLYSRLGSDPAAAAGLLLHVRDLKARILAYKALHVPQVTDVEEPA